MYCKHCGTEIGSGEAVCPGCGKQVGSNTLKIIGMAIAGVLVVAIMAGVVYVGTNGWPDFGSTAPTEESGAAQTATTPTDGNAEDVSCKGSYTADDPAVIAAKDIVVATMGEQKLTNGQLQTYYWLEVADFLNYYGSYLSYIGLDYTKPLDQQLYDQETEQSWQQYFLQAALESWQRDQALTAQAEQAGFQLEPVYQEYLDGLQESLQEAAEENKFESVDAMLQADMGAAADFAGYQYYIRRYYMGNLYFEEAKKKLPVTNEELEAYFTENAETLESEYGATKESGQVAGMEYVMFYPEGATADTVVEGSFSQEAWDAAQEKASATLNAWVAGGASEEAFRALAEEAAKSENAGGTGGTLEGLTPYFAAEVDIRHVLIEPAEKTDAGWEECRKQAQALLDAWVAGGASEEAFAAMAKEHTADGNGDVGGIYENVTKGKMVAEFDAWIFDASRVPGDYGLVKTDYGYHIMYFVHADRELDNWAFAEGRVAGDYGLVRSDYGYYLVRSTGTEEAWVYYSRDGVQTEKMNGQALAGYDMTVDYGQILLAEVKLG